MKNNREDRIREELQKRIIDFNRYRFNINEYGGIITVQPVGPELEGYEAEADSGGKSFDKTIDELIPRVTKLIAIYKEKSNEK